MGRPRSGPRAHSFVSRSRIALTPHPLLAGDVGRPGLQIVAFDGRAKRIGREASAELASRITSGRLRKSFS
jgi:hypothetical protein